MTCKARSKVLDVFQPRRTRYHVLQPPVLILTGESTCFSSKQHSVYSGLFRRACIYSSSFKIMQSEPAFSKLQDNVTMYSGELREYWIIYTGPCFLAVVWSGSSPTPSRQYVRPATHRKTETENHLLTGEGGRGWRRRQIVRRRESLVLHESYSLGELNTRFRPPPALHVGTAGKIHLN